MTPSGPPSTPARQAQSQAAGRGTDAQQAAQTGKQEAEKQAALWRAQRERIAQRVQLAGRPPDDSAAAAATRNGRAEVHALGYTRAGQSCCRADEREGTFGGAGLWKAAVPLFSFRITPPAAAGAHCIARSSADFERLHALMLKDAAAGAVGAAELPKLPGRKRFNANEHVHLLKRVHRYAEYLRLLVQAPSASGADALNALESFLAPAAGEPQWHPATYVPEADLLFRENMPGLSLAQEGRDTPREDEDVRRVRAMLAQQQRSQKDMTRLLQRLIWHAFFDPSARILHKSCALTCATTRILTCAYKYS